MNSLIKILVKSGLLTKDLDYHLDSAGQRIGSLAGRWMRRVREDLQGGQGPIPERSEDPRVISLRRTPGNCLTSVGRIEKKSFHLGRVHAAIGLRDVENRDAEIGKDVAGIRWMAMRPVSTA